MVELIIYSIFGCGALILAGEFLYEHENLRGLAHSFQYFGTLSLVILLPWTYYILMNGEITLFRKGWGARRIVFYFLSWTFYLCCIVILAITGIGWWSWVFIQLRGWAIVISICGMLAAVFMVSGSYAVDTQDLSVVGDAVAAMANHLGKLRIFFSMKVLLTITAVVLGILSEISWLRHKNSPLAVLEGVLSIGLFIVVLFNTHGSGGRLIHLHLNFQQKDGNDTTSVSRWRFWQPFVGGAKFVALQIFSWGFFGCSVLLEVVFIVATVALGLEIFVGITALAGACCMISELLMIMSLFAFESPPEVIKVTASTSSTTSTITSERMTVEGVISDKQHLVIETASATASAIESMALGKRADKLEMLYSYVSFLHELIPAVVIVNIQFIPYIVLFPLFCVSAQPLVTVAVHWAFGCSVVILHNIFCAVLKTRAIKSDKLDLALPGAVGILGCVVAADRTLVPELWDSYWTVVPWTLFGAIYCSYVALTYCGSPEINGHREVNNNNNNNNGPPSSSTSVSGAASDDGSAATASASASGDRLWSLGYWKKRLTALSVTTTSAAMTKLGDLVRRYFRGRVLSRTILDTKRLYVFGFHPHGILPITLFWMCAGRIWDTLLPGINCCVLTASIMHVVPLLRDLLQWAGGREISRDTFRRTLVEGRNCVVVPGGQAEMLESRSGDRDVRVVTKHIGFIRMAIQEGAWLVPIISFGEVDILDNVRLPTLQQWFIRRFGAAMPHYPYGYLGLPIPRRVQVTVVVGDPIPTVKKADPSVEEINQMLSVYMMALKALFEEYREEAGERSDRRLVFVGDDGQEVDFSVPVPVSTVTEVTSYLGETVTGEAAAVLASVPAHCDDIDSSIVTTITTNTTTTTTTLQQVELTPENLSNEPTSAVFDDDDFELVEHT
eukprot:gene7272-14821_t